MEPTAGRRATRVATPPNSDVSGGDTAVRWVPITELTELARALLGERPSGRDVVPAQVAERISRLAAQWAANGFTAATVRPWVDLPPAAAKALAAAGATPEALDRHVVTVAGTTTTLWRAVSSGGMTGEEAAAAFKPATTPPASDGPDRDGDSKGTPSQSRGASRNAFSASAPESPGAYKAAARPATETFKAPPEAEQESEKEEAAATRAKIAPAVFSHPAAETVADTDDRRRRSAPPQTPFSTS
ncbi:hypothetical protein ACFO1B_13335 [Dactylosporangium siamense]|uniref:Uncharacterized protein n=1 Tax=Dactylosporangium siamense TaxID=685454 RepID=A0A919PW65_9ACTN|nr:hypothetical protein [Dactylosporangium siamense]GIG49703.1 hypothetical protein Dsi01nite_077440 [Dactylosporangium siamense]